MFVLDISSDFSLVFNPALGAAWLNGSRGANIAKRIIHLAI